MLKYFFPNACFKWTLDVEIDIYIYLSVTTYIGAMLYGLLHLLVSDY